MRGSPAARPAYDAYDSRKLSGPTPTSGSASESDTIRPVLISVTGIDAASPFAIEMSAGATKAARYHDSCPSLVKRSHNDWVDREANRSAPMTAVNAAIATTPRSRPRAL